MNCQHLPSALCRHTYPLSCFVQHFGSLLCLSNVQVFQWQLAGEVTCSCSSTEGSEILSSHPLDCIAKRMGAKRRSAVELKVPGVSHGLATWHQQSLHDRQVKHSICPQAPSQLTLVPKSWSPKPPQRPQSCHSWTLLDTLALHIDRDKPHWQPLLRAAHSDVQRLHGVVQWPLG